MRAHHETCIALNETDKNGGAGAISCPTVIGAKLVKSPGMLQKSEF